MRMNWRKSDIWGFHLYRCSTLITKVQDTRYLDNGGTIIHRALNLGQGTISINRKTPYKVFNK